MRWILKSKPSCNWAKYLVMVVISCNMVACVVVHEYEKVNINDPDMDLSIRKSDRFETAFQVYREAASGANGGKAGGGCGCN